MIYKFRTGTTHRGIDAQTAGDELERIRVSNGGRLRPEDVVDEAVSTDSPLHNVFTWDDAKAAHEFRLTEARQFIRSVVVKVDSQASVPAFWSIAVATVNDDGEQSHTERHYQSAAVIAQSPNEYDAALETMQRELTAAENGLMTLRRIAPRGRKLKIDRAARYVRSAQDSLV